MNLTDFFITHPVVLLSLSLVLGLIVGSFLNVVIYRLPIMMERDWTRQCCELLETEQTQPQPTLGHFNLAVPGSHCRHCGHRITAKENIPLLSYLLQKGKCRACQAPISLRYPLIESLTGLLSLLVVYSFGVQWLTLALLVFTWSLIVLTMIDTDHQLLPDSITQPLLWLGLIINSQGWLTTLHSAVWGAVAGYLILWVVFWGFKLLTGKEGMGFGDFKLLAALGAWLGWQSLPQIILMSSLAGAVMGIGLIAIRGQDRSTPIPFGPYLAAAGFIAMLWGPQINNLYLLWTM